MLNRIRSAAAQIRTEADARLEFSPSAEAHAFFNRQIAAMPVVAPAQAANDDPLAELTVVVEQELLDAGYLR